MFPAVRLHKQLFLILNMKASWSFNISLIILAKQHQTSRRGKNIRTRSSHIRFISFHSQRNMPVKRKVFSLFNTFLSSMFYLVLVVQILVKISCKNLAFSSCGIYILYSSVSFPLIPMPLLITSCCSSKKMCFRRGLGNR